MASDGAAVLRAQGLNQLYRKPEVEVRALTSVDLKSGAASASCCWALRAVARARC
jgi:hypothetical protein